MKQLEQRMLVFVVQIMSDQSKRTQQKSKDCERDALTLLCSGSSRCRSRTRTCFLSEGLLLSALCDDAAAAPWFQLTRIVGSM